MQIFFLLKQLLPSQQKKLQKTLPEYCTNLFENEKTKTRNYTNIRNEICQLKTETKKNICKITAIK